MTLLHRFAVADISIALLTGAMGVAVAVTNADMRSSALEPIGPSAFPLSAALILIALSLVVLIRGLTPRTPPPEETEIRKRHDLALIALALTAAYFASMGWEILSFGWATALYAFLLTGTLFGWRPNRIPAAILSGAILGFGLRAVFTHLLFIDLP